MYGVTSWPYSSFHLVYPRCIQAFMGRVPSISLEDIPCLVLLVHVSNDLQKTLTSFETMNLAPIEFEPHNYFYASPR